MKRKSNITAKSLAVIASITPGLWLPLEATTPTLTSITQPLYYLGSAEDDRIQFVKTPKILNNADAMFWVLLFHSSTEIYGSDGDINLISLYGLTVSLSEQDSNGVVKRITIDSSKSLRPPRYPFTVDEVVDAAIEAVRMEFPDENVTTIKVKTE